MKTRKMLLMGIVVALSTVTLIGCKTKKELRTKNLEKFVDNTQLLPGFTSLENKFENPKVDKEGFVTIAGQKIKTKDVYKDYYSTEIDENFNYLVNQGSWNSFHYTNLVEGLIGNDKYGNLVGFMAKGFKNHIDEEGNTVWTIQIREGIRWVENATGNYFKDAVVDADDFVAAAKYVLNPLHGSNTAGFYTKNIKNADKYFKQTPENPVDFETVGVKKVSKYQIQYINNGKVPYFLSILTYSPFLPVEQAFLDQKGSDFAKTFNDMLVNGAFLVNKHIVNNKIIYEKNMAYWNLDNVYFNWAEMKFVDSKLKTATTLKELFKAGDIDLFKVEQKDAEGWKEYVLGTNNTGTLMNPANEDATTFITNGNGATMYGTFNFNRKTFDQFQKTDQQKKATKLAVQNANFRKAFLYGMNFILYLKYFDSIDPTFHVFRGLTLPELARHEGQNKDYADLVEDVYNANNGTNVSLSGIKAGQDQVYNSDKAKQLLALAKQELLTQGLTEADFPILIDIPSHANTEHNSFLTRMYDDFAQVIGQNEEIVKIRQAVPADDQELRKWVFTTQNYDLTFFSGWGPDYADPSTFLAIVAKNGDIVNNLGLKLAENATEEEKEIEEKILGPHTKRFEIANKITDDYDKRLEEFAKVEYELVFNDVLIIPYRPYAAGRDVTISRVVPYTRSKSSYGLAADRLAGIIASDHILLKTQREAIIQAYFKK